MFPAVRCGSPGYTHMVAFSREVKLDPSKATADVIPDRGTMIWPKAMGMDACILACALLKDITEKVREYMRL